MAAWTARRRGLLRARGEEGGAVERLRARLPASAWDRAALGALVVLLAAGAGIRLYAMLAWRPAFLGYPDSEAYIGAAYGGLLNDPLRVWGYPLFLRALHLVNPHLSFTILVQHALGVLSAVILYATVRRAGARPWAALLPAAIVLFGGAEIFLEHAALTEALSVFLQAVALYAAVRAWRDRSIGWAAAAGLVLAVGVTVRVSALFLLPVLVLWLGLAPGVPVRRRLGQAAVASVLAAVVLGGYLGAHYEKTHFLGFTRAGMWNLYGRAATFAKCSAFTPPPGTRVLCESKPPSKRNGPNHYLYDLGTSPAYQRFGSPFVATYESNAKVAAFARAAIVHQPLDYAGVVARDMVRYVAPRSHLYPGQGYEYTGMFQYYLFDGKQLNEVQRVVPAYYSTSGYLTKPAMVRNLKAYERHTRLKGPLMVLLILLSLIAPIVARRGSRGVAAFLTAFTAVAMIIPPATLFWDVRYAVPTFGLLGMSAAMGASGVWELVAARRRRGRRAEPAPQAAAATASPSFSSRS